MWSEYGYQAKHPYNLDNNWAQIGMIPNSKPLAGDKVGGAGCFGHAGWYQDSDRNLKTNITPLADPLTRIDGLSGVSYNWNERAKGHYLKGLDQLKIDPNATEEENETARQQVRDAVAKTQIGLIAQEVQQVLPEAVETGPEGDLMVNYQQVIPLLVEGIKTLQKENEETRSELADLKQQVAALTAAMHS